MIHNQYILTVID